MVKLQRLLLIAMCTVGLGWGIALSNSAMAQSADAESTQSDGEAKADEGYRKIQALADQGRYAEAIPIAQEVLSIVVSEFGEGHPRTVVPLSLLATLHKEQGDYSLAVSFYERAIAIMNPLLDQGIPDPYNVLGRLASLHSEQGNYSLALPLYERSLTVREAILGADHPDVASSLSNLGLTLYHLGEYSQALPPLERALSIRESALGKDSPEVANVLNTLAGLHEVQGDYDLALSMYERSLSINQVAFGDRHPTVALTQSNLAALYSAQGDYASAFSLLEQALSVLESALGPNHPDVATVLNNLADTHTKKGDYVSALPLLERALSISEATSGKEHPDVAATLVNLALLYDRQGNEETAIPLLERAIAIQETTLGENHPNLAYSLNGLALIYKEQQSYAAALTLLKQTLSIFEQALGENHPTVATVLNNLGGTYQEKGDYTAALPFYERALLISEATLGKTHPDVANRLNNIALLHVDEKEYSKALPLFERALSIRETVLDRHHPTLANSLYNLASLYHIDNDIDRAVDLYTSASEIEERNISEMMLQSSETRRQRYINTLSLRADIIVSTNIMDAPNNPAATRLALSTILRRKGRVLDAVSNTSQQLRSQLSPENRTLLDTLNDIRSSITNLRFSESAGTNLEQQRSEIAQLENQAEQIEETLARSSAEFAIATEPVSISDVQSAIPTNAALVEFVRYLPADIENPQAPARYAAYVVTQRGNAQPIDLGEAAQIDRLVAQFRRSLSSRSADVKEIGRQLDQQLMAPIRPFLASKEHLLISPDSQLTLVPFETLVDESDRYLIERYQTSYLTSGRDLLSLRLSTPSRQQPVIFANPNYENVSGTLQANAESTRSVDATSLSFSPLPGTAEEAEAIFPLLANANLYTQAEATETVLKQLEAPSILHIATHGFFLPDVDFVPPASPDEQRGLGASLEVVSVGTPTPVVSGNIDPSNLENPLLRSGLALAGVNNRNGSASSDDGIFTALEASGLNLHGTRLVVLSACDTGVGTVSTGEGVYGLRRAFVTAGAQSQLMSLWQVDDYGTSELMRLYYENLISQRQGRSEALRTAQLEMMGTGTYAHPYYWSAFIFSGDWRPLD
ncbi:MAG: tetratricopeptide repeat protein [Cyanobacteria bacterium P01_D01_bin.1]